MLVWNVPDVLTANFPATAEYVEGAHTDVKDKDVQYVPPAPTARGELDVGFAIHVHTEKERVNV